MNPLDKDELDNFLANLNLEMPLHTDYTAKIKHSFSQNLPKNLMDYSAQVNNKFLNDNLAIVEEIKYRDPKNIIPKYFQEYQIKYYSKHEILNHDNFFKAGLNDKIRACLESGTDLPQISGGTVPYAGGMIGFGSQSSQKILGTALETNSSATTGQAYGGTLFSASISATIGDYYDTMSTYVQSLGTNKQTQLAVYDNSTNMVKQADTGTFNVSATAYNSASVTEFSIPSTTVWFAITCGNDDTQHSATTNTRRYLTPVTIGSLPNPWTSYTTNSGLSSPRIKLTHS